MTKKDGKGINTIDSFQKDTYNQIIFGKDMQFFENSLDMLCIANTNGEFLKLNPEWEKVLGYSVAELENKQFLDFVHPDDIKATINTIKDLENQIEVTSFTNRYRRTDGNYRWIEWRSKPINHLIYAVARDITKHIEIQENLSIQEKQYRMIAENVADVVWTTDLALNTTWVSPSIYKLTGETPEEHMETKIQDRISKNDLLKLNNLFQQHLLLEEDPKVDKKRSVEIELQHTKKNGNNIWVSMKMTFLRDEHGHPIGIHGVTRDISERVKRDHALKEQKYRQEILLSASEKLINAVPEKLSSVINSALSEVSQISSADRIYLFEHDYQREVTSNIYEWCNEGIEPQIDQLQNIPFSTFKQWLYYHRKYESIVINEVQALPEGDSVREILETQGIKSLITVPLLFEGELFGFIGFDSVRKHHLYTKEEQLLLHQFANNLVMIIKKERYTSKLKRTDEKLRSANNLLKSMFNSIQDGVSVLNADLTIIEVNQKILELYGNSNELVGSHCYEVYQNRKKPCKNCPTKRSFESKKVCSEILPMIVDGQQKGWLEVFSYPMVDSSTANVEGVVEFVRDITERKKIEDDLLIKAHVLDQIQDTVTVTDLDGNIMYVNFAESKTLGYSSDELIGLSTQIFGEDEEQGATQQEIIEETLQHGRWRGEVVNKTVDGKEVIHDTRTQIIMDNQGNKIALAGVSTDITQRKEMEKQIVGERERFKTTILSVGDGVISTDEIGNVVILNPVAERLTGWTQEEAFGKSIEEVFYITNEFTRQRCENPVQKVLDTGQIIELPNHTILISKDGIERPIEDSAAPIRNRNGVITGVVLVFRDFTEKKESLNEIKYLSFHDHLTGLYNRRFFEAEMERLDTERNLPISIIMGDVNGLKLINDSFGHEAGDELLIKATEIIKSCLRSDDIVARIGGDEFVVLLPKTANSESKALVKRMQSELKEEKIKDITVSVSFGLETKTNPTESLALVLKKAEDNMYKNKLFESPSMRGKVVENIIATINKKSSREKAHSERVSELIIAIGIALEMDEKDINELKVLGLFHDIGKIAVSDDILNKPDKLTDREYKEICRHAEIGYRILSTANGLSDIAEYVLYHHERWDGKGYPKGLTGEAIPVHSRICAIADAYDAMTSDRSYRPAMTNEYAVEELSKNAGSQFDPDIVEIFIEKVMSNSQ